MILGSVTRFPPVLSCASLWPETDRSNLPTKQRKAGERQNIVVVIVFLVPPVVRALLSLWICVRQDFRVTGVARLVVSVNESINHRDHVFLDGHYSVRLWTGPQRDLMALSVYTGSL